MYERLSAVARAVFKGCSIPEAKKDINAAQRRCEVLEGLVSAAVIERSKLQAKIHTLNKKEIAYLEKLRDACAIRDSHRVPEEKSGDESDGRDISG